MTGIYHQLMFLKAFMQIMEMVIIGQLVNWEIKDVFGLQPHLRNTMLNPQDSVKPLAGLPATTVAASRMFILSAV